MFDKLATAAQHGPSLISKVTTPQAAEGTEKSKKGKKAGKASKADAGEQAVAATPVVEAKMNYIQAENLYHSLWQQHMLKAMDENLYPLDEQDLRFSTAINLEVVRSRHFCVVGVGGIGAPIVRNLVGMGARNISIVDYDTVDIHNVGPQGYALADMGKFKVQSLHDEIMRHRGISINAVNKKIDNYDHLCSLLGGTAPEVLVLAIDHLDSRTAILSQILGSIDYMFGMSRGPDFDTRLIKLPQYVVVTAMTLGLWNVYTIPCRALLADYESDAGVTRELAALRRKFLKETVTPRLIFKNEDAVQESCTARSIIYTGSTIAGYVCAMMHWFCENEAELYLGSKMAEYLDSGAVSDNPFKWIRVFNARTFQDGMLSPAFMREMAQSSKIIEEMMGMQERMAAWKTTVQDITGMSFPDSLADLLSMNLTGKMVRVPDTSGPILRYSDGMATARNDLWMYVVVDYHNTAQCSAAALVYDRRAMMRGQAFGYGNAQDDATRGKIQTLYGILFDSHGNLVCPVTQKTEDENGPAGLPCGYEMTAQSNKGATFLAGGGSFKSLLWGMPRKDIVCVRQPSPLESVKAAKVAHIGKEGSEEEGAMTRIEDLRVGDLLKLPAEGSQKKDLTYVLLGVGFIKVGVSSAVGVAGMPNNSVGHMPSLLSGLYTTTLVMVTPDMLDGALPRAAGGQTTFRSIIKDLERRSCSPGFVVDAEVHEAIDGQAARITKMNTHKHLTRIRHLGTGDPLHVFTDEEVQAAEGQVAADVAAPAAAAVMPWDKLIYSDEEFPWETEHDVVPEAMWLGAVPVSAGMRVQWKLPGDTSQNEDIVGRIVVLKRAPEFSGMYVELTVRQVWIRADACLTGIVGDTVPQPQEPQLVDITIDAVDEGQIPTRVGTRRG